MRVDRQIDLLDSVLVFPRDRQLVDHLGRVGADDVRAENLTVFLVAQNLDESVGFAGAARAAIGRERKLPGDVIEFFLLALVFGQPNARDLGVTVGHARDVVILDRMRLLAGQQLGDDHTFTTALVRQHGRTGDVANRVIAGGRRLQILVDLDEAAVGHLDAALFEPDVLGIHGAARGHQHGGGHDLFLLAARFHIERDLVLGHVGLRHLGAGDHLDTALAVALGERVRGLGVFDGKNAWEGLDERDLHAERREDIGELHADRAGADDRQGLGNALHQERLVGRNHGRLVDLEADLRNPFDAGTGRDHDGLFRLVDVVADLHLLAGLQHAGASHDRNLVLLHQKLDPFGVLIGNPARALHRDTVVGLHAAGLDAKVLGFLEQIGDVGGVEQRFGRNAADVHADAAQLLLLDHRRRETELRAADRAHVARGPAAKNDHVKTRHRYSLIADFGLWIADSHGGVRTQSAIRNRQSAITTALPAGSRASASESSDMPHRWRRR